MKHLLLLFALCPLLSALSQLPLELKPGTRIALIGNSLFDRMRDDGQFESLLHQRFAKEKLIIRNLSWSADEVALRPRPDGFGDLNQHLTEHRADVILAAFGFNESFKGAAGVAEFELLLKSFLIELKSHHYNGKTAPVIVLVSPTQAEKPHEHLNAQIEMYSDAMEKVAKAEGVGFAVVRESSRGPGAPREDSRTTNGVHLNERGYTLFAESLFRELTQETPPKLNAAVRAAVVEKEDKFFQYYRPLNYYYIKGGRAEPYGVVNFPGELQKLKQMAEARDRHTWSSADFTDGTDSEAKTESEKSVQSVDDTPLPVITGDRHINEWLSPAAELAAFKVDPRFEVSLFASEEEFPDLFVKAHRHPL